jgi:hypothetical protein
MCSEVIYPSELLWCSARSCCLAPIHFQPSYRQPGVEASLHVSCEPLAAGLTCSERDLLIPVTLWPCSLLAVYHSLLFSSFSPHAVVGPKAAAAAGHKELVRAQHAVILVTDLASWRVVISLPMSRL